MTSPVFAAGDRPQDLLEDATIQSAIPDHDHDASTWTASEGNMLQQHQAPRPQALEDDGKDVEEQLTARGKRGKGLTKTHNRPHPSPR